MPSPEPKEKIQRILTELAATLEREWPQGEVHINEIEDLAQRASDQLRREVTQEILGEQSRRRAGNQVACSCGGRAVYRGDYSLPYVTGHGRMPVHRAYFYCAQCKQGHCPLDRVWGLGPANTTPTVQALVAAFAVEVAYTRSMGLLERAGVPFHLGTKSIELIAQGVGREVQQNPPRLSTRAERSLAVAVDGTIMPTRDGGKEVRCGVIYEPDWDAGRTPAAERGLRKEYFATTASRDQLIQSVCAQVERRRPTPETVVAALGDGAPWIWRGYAKYLPQRLEILDFYHVVTHLKAAADAWYGEGTEKGKLWIAAMKGALKGGGPDMLLRSLRAWRPTTAAGKRVRTRELGYFRKNRQRMNYHAYLEQGLAIGSGSVEGACKQVVGGRFKRAGMRWNVATAEPLLHLRAAVLSQPGLDLRQYVTAPMLA